MKRTAQQKRFAAAAKEASRRVKKDPRLDFLVQMRLILAANQGQAHTRVKDKKK